LVAIGYLARAEGGVTYRLSSEDGLFFLEGYRDRPLPFFLNGRGRSPGEVRVVDRDERVIDELRLEDVESVQHVRWSRFAVNFTYERGGRTYESALDLPQ
jgi:hypothetical protein